MPATAATTFIQEARRAQLVGAAIEVIAAVGADRASTVQIARHAGVSRGVLTYHFRDRAALIDAVVEEVYRVAGDELTDEIRSAPSPRASLLTFVGGSIDFYARHPHHMTALVEIFAATEREDHPRHVREGADVAAILRAGQEQGQFRDFDVTTMFRVIRAVLDAALARLRDTGEATQLRAEIVEAVDAMTRAA